MDCDWLTDSIIMLVWMIYWFMTKVVDLLSSRVNDLLKLSERYRIGRLFWPIVSTIGLSGFHIIVLTLVIALSVAAMSYLELSRLMFVAEASSIKLRRLHIRCVWFARHWGGSTFKAEDLQRAEFLEPWCTTRSWSIFLQWNISPLLSSVEQCVYNSRKSWKSPWICMVLLEIFV